RIFVVEQGGIIQVFPNSGSVTSANTFLDLSNIVSTGSERGLLGLAFHPDYTNNGYFYVNFTIGGPTRTLISRFEVSSANPNSADENSEVNLITFNQPDTHHNGGWLGFGPNDGFLYIATGDGGHAGDPDDNAQDVTNFLGNFLRIDVDNQESGMQYAIPLGNPFYNSTGDTVREIFAWGLRNSWRNSFDPMTGWLWAADVGQNNWEEIDIITNGKNYGWRSCEGMHEYPPNSSPCDNPEYINPIWEYDHDQGCSVTGGYVYRGQNIPGLIGKYIYGDYCQKTVWSLDIADTSNQSILTAPGRIVSFGVDQSSELYVLTFNPDNIYMFFDPLPVELVSFKGEYINSRVSITWETATEINNYGFDLERTVNSNGWNKIAFIPGKGNSNSPKYYNYTDTDLQSAGVFKYRLKQIDTDGSYDYSNEISVNVNKPDKFLLGQNYPNPFNPKTRIDFRLAEKQRVSLRVYNMLGEMVKELVNEVKSAGIYSVTFDGTNLPSGIYVYRIQTKGFSENKKMTLIK
ncbi:MAG: PQQ-dependent sugar dehydrogenase, partial [Ignavibacteria bacterium]|nr:PQQ-dependent sugar dehydrogenase [Ignavibacteria bacterium]